MPIRCSRKAVTVSSGSHSPVSLKAFSPARTSFQATGWPCLAAAASKTRRAAGQMSTPVPSPSMKGMMGSLGTTRTPSSSTVMRCAMGRAYGSRRPGMTPGSIGWCRSGGGHHARKPEGAVDLAGRAGPVQCVEVEPRGPFGQEPGAQLGGQSRCRPGGRPRRPPRRRPLPGGPRPREGRPPPSGPSGGPSRRVVTGMMPGRTGLVTPRLPGRPPGPGTRRPRRRTG